MIDREHIFARDSYTCCNCGQPVLKGQPQIAHRIKQGKGTENYLKKYIMSKYGIFAKPVLIKRIVHHEKNLRSTCCLSCNDAQNIFYKPEQRDRLVDEILEGIMEF